MHSWSYASTVSAFLDLLVVVFMYFYVCVYVLKGVI